MINDMRYREHDIKTVVLLQEYSVHEIYTADTDFLQFTFLKVTNPIKEK